MAAAAVMEVEVAVIAAEATVVVVTAAALAAAIPVEVVTPRAVILGVELAAPAAVISEGAKPTLTAATSAVLQAADLQGATAAHLPQVLQSAQVWRSPMLDCMAETVQRLASAEVPALKAGEVISHTQGHAGSEQDRTAKDTGVIVVGATTVFALRRSVIHPGGAIGVGA